MFKRAQSGIKFVKMVTPKHRLPKDDEELPIDGRTQKFVVNRDGKVEEG